MRSGSSPSMRKTPRSQGSWWFETTMMRTPSTRNSAVGPQLTVTPVYIGPSTVKRPSLSFSTVPVTSSGRPSSPMAGMSVLPPSGRVSVAPSPAARMRSTASGSHRAATATSSRPWRSTSAMTVIESCVAPEPQLSAWSSRMIGPRLSVAASATACFSGRPR